MINPKLLAAPFLALTVMLVDPASGQSETPEVGRVIRPTRPPKTTDPPQPQGPVSPPPPVSPQTGSGPESRDGGNAAGGGVGAAADDAQPPPTGGAPVPKTPPDRGGLGDPLPLEGWGNPRGLAELIAYLSKQGLDRIGQWRLVRLDHGRCDFNHAPLDGAASGSRAIAVVSESPADDLNLRLSDLDLPDRSAVDEGTEKDAAIRLLPRWTDVQASTWEPSASSAARVLVIEATSGEVSGIGLDTVAAEIGKLSPADPKSPSSSHPDPVGVKGGIAIIPLRGMVGFDGSTDEFFTAFDFTAALDHALAAEPAMIILEINSPGGRVDTKEEILRAMLKASADGVRFAALVQDAGSAAALIAVACHTILVYPEARIGAAVTILSNGVGMVSLKEVLKDDPELEAKMTSFSDALDRECAKSIGRSPAISDAMKDSKHELWWSARSGFSAAEPHPGAERLDSMDSVLTLTRTDIIRTGLGKLILQTQEPWKILGFDTDPGTSRIENAMRQTRNEIEGLISSHARNGGLDQAQYNRLRQIFAQP